MMNYDELLDSVEKILSKKYDLETALLLCSRADSHEPWLTESDRKDFTKTDVDRLASWLSERKNEPDFK